jgi:hypothetical protein
MPSYFESLSMVALEAWALGKPVLANGQCDVLRGQCIRSNGGLYYDNFAEFVETLRAIDFNPTLAAALGRHGREYFQSNYTWPIIERKYLDMLERLEREQPATTTPEPWPGWFARRRRTLPPANEILATLPKGAVLTGADSSVIRESQRQAPVRGTASPRTGFSPGVQRNAADIPGRGHGAGQGSSRPTGVAAKAGGRGAHRGRPPRNRRPGGRPPRRPGHR